MQLPTWLHFVPAIAQPLCYDKPGQDPAVHPAGGRNDEAGQRDTIRIVSKKLSRRGDATQVVVPEVVSEAWAHGLSFVEWSVKFIHVPAESNLVKSACMGKQIANRYWIFEAARIGKLTKVLFDVLIQFQESDKYNAPSLK